tara:strand:- start:219 stop:479 length:261 start_codon:yes stop_codon:yes gene_type:complete
MKIINTDETISQEVKDIVSELVNYGGVTDKLDLIMYAVDALHRAGMLVGEAGRHTESSCAFLSSFDESSELGMIYYTEHPKFSYSF